jgi:hypothetical protein
MSEPFREELVTRAVSDADLVTNGAVFQDGTLRITDEQYTAIAANPETPLIIPDEVANAANPLQAGRELVRSAHLRQQIGKLSTELDPEDPPAYLQHLRDYALQSATNSASADYDLGYSYSSKPLISSERMQREVDNLGAELHAGTLASHNHRRAAEANDPSVQHLARFAALNGLRRQAVDVDSLSKRIGEKAQELGVDWAQPSLIEMPEAQQRALLATMYYERRELMTRAIESDLTVTGPYIKVDATRALLFRNLDELYAAIEQRPEIEPSRIVSSFISRSLVFPEMVRNFRSAEEQTARRLAAPQKITEYEQTFRRNAREVLSNPNRPSFSEDLEPGEIIYPESLAGIDDAVFSALAQLEAAATRDYGAPETNVWSSRLLERSVAEMLRPAKFNGKLENPRVTILPTTPEFTEKLLDKLHTTDIDPQSVVRLGAVADMKSTGRGVVGQSVVEAAIYTRYADDPTKRRQLMSIWRKADGARVAAYLNNEAGTRGANILRRAIARPLPGGRMRPR